VAISAAGKFKYPTGKKGAVALGYDPVFIRDAPESLLKSFCGVGNPFSLGDIQPGYSVLDIGSGAGFDLYVAKRLAGETGRVCGIDLTKEMVDIAQKNLAETGMSDIEIIHVLSEKIPYDENTFDTVISNGVINLSPCKQEIFQEIFRVLICRCCPGKRTSRHAGRQP
jgi:2-polyprenyl-3-methyl-5-hydroxy-6-metoxy-1,4-benzoquinol methylase